MKSSGADVRIRQRECEERRRGGDEEEREGVEGRKMEMSAGQSISSVTLLDG